MNTKQTKYVIQIWDSHDLNLEDNTTEYFIAFSDVKDVAKERLHFLDQLIKSYTTNDIEIYHKLVKSLGIKVLSTYISVNMKNICSCKTFPFNFEHANVYSAYDSDTANSSDSNETIDLESYEGYPNPADTSSEENDQDSTESELLKLYNDISTESAKYEPNWKDPLKFSNGSLKLAAPKNGFFIIFDPIEDENKYLDTLTLTDYIARWNKQKSEFYKYNKTTFQPTGTEFHRKIIFYKLAKGNDPVTWNSDPIGNSVVVIDRLVKLDYIEYCKRKLASINNIVKLKQTLLALNKWKNIYETQKNKEMKWSEYEDDCPILVGNNDDGFGDDEYDCDFDREYEYHEWD